MELLTKRLALVCGLVILTVTLAWAQTTIMSSIPLSGNSGDVLKGDGSFAAATAPSGGLPSGVIVLLLSGTCPTGTSEVAALAGVTLVGTLAANDDVGDTGGDDTITPAGTNSVPTFTGNASTAIVNHTHGFTNVRGATTGGATTAYSGIVAGSDTSSAATPAVTGDPVSGGAANYTPAGTVTAPVFTGTEFDNRSAYVKVIFCQAE